MTPASERPAVLAEAVSCAYGQGRLRVPVLQDATFSIPPGVVTAITGPSGSGKTTLLSLLGGLDVVDAGRLEVDGEVLSDLGPRRLRAFRRERVGFVFQAFHLLPTLTVQENVEAGLEPLGLGRAEQRARAEEALAAVAMDDKLRRFPHELSGGEQQRVAVARACAKRPRLLLADEPTGNLDEDAGARVLDLLLRRHVAQPMTLVLVTHDAGVAARADHQLLLRAHQIETHTGPSTS